jgi:uncharacterized protein (TIGR03546 family)
MYALIKFIQSLIKALNSEGTPGQVAAGMAMGAALGLTPVANIHNVLILCAAMMLNVSLPGVFLGWVLFVPVGFALDPLFDQVGRTLLLDTPALSGLFSTIYNTPVLALTNLNNSIVLGSLLGWVVLWFPIFLLCRWLVALYRRTVYERLRRMKLFRAVQASKVYNWYKMFKP